MFLSRTIWYSHRVGDEARDTRDQDRPYLQLGRFLSTARRDAGLTRNEVIDRLQASRPVSYPMLANLESGRRRLSDDLLVHLAPALGVTEDALRVLRDETDEARANQGVSQRESARRLREARNRLAHQRTEKMTSDQAVERLYGQILQQSQELEVLSRAVGGAGSGDFDGRSGRIASVVTDLRALDENALDQVHAFIKGLLAAQGRQVSAVDPLASVPFVRVPEGPFGPRQTLTLPDWMLAMPDAAHAQAEARELGERHPVFEQRVEEPRSIGRRIADRMLTAAAETAPQLAYSWPSPRVLAAAAEAGLYLRPKGRIERGQVSVYDWIRFVTYGQVRESRKVDSLVALWVTRMVFIAGVTRGPSTHAVNSFIEECLPYARELTARSPRSAFEAT